MRVKDRLSINDNTTHLYTWMKRGTKVFLISTQHFSSPGKEKNCKSKLFSPQERNTTQHNTNHTLFLLTSKVVNIICWFLSCYLCNDSLVKDIQLKYAPPKREKLRQINFQTHFSAEDNRNAVITVVSCKIATNKR